MLEISYILNTCCEISRRPPIHPHIPFARQILSLGQDQADTVMTTDPSPLTWLDRLSIVLGLAQGSSSSGSSGPEGDTKAGREGVSGLLQLTTGEASHPGGQQRQAAGEDSSPAGQLDTRLGPAISNLGDVYRIKVSVPPRNVPLPPRPPILNTHCALRYFPQCLSQPEVPVLPSCINCKLSSLSLRARSLRHSAATGWPRRCKWTCRGHGCGWDQPAGTPGSMRRQWRRSAEQSGSTRRGASGTRRLLAWCSASRCGGA